MLYEPLLAEMSASKHKGADPAGAFHSLIKSEAARTEYRKRETIMKKTHKTLLEILTVFDELCRLNDIQYSLHGGTLLGAVRENGFIPWDDDADVTMTRKDFRKLMAVMDQTDMAYRLRGNIKKQFYKVDNDQLWMDIFVCDYISEKRFFQKVKLLWLTALDIMYRDSESMKLSNLEKYSKTKQLVYKVIFLVGQIFPKKWIAKGYAAASEKRLQGKKVYMFRSNDQYIGRKMVFPASWMEEYEYVPFENTELPVFRERHHFLVQSYGEDYMNPIRESRNAAVHNVVRSAQKIKL